MTMCPGTRRRITEKGPGDETKTSKCGQTGGTRAFNTVLISTCESLYCCITRLYSWHIQYNNLILRPPILLETSVEHSLHRAMAPNCCYCAAVVFVIWSKGKVRSIAIASWLSICHVVFGGCHDRSGMAVCPLTACTCSIAAGRAGRVTTGRGHV
jgi:hypothetical protein